MASRSLLSLTPTARALWPDENRHLHNWLASDEVLAVFSRLLGVRLTDPDFQQKVPRAEGTSGAERQMDIVAMTPHGGHVIIEGQLTRADLRHRDNLVHFYANGSRPFAGPQRAIWVATSFPDPMLDEAGPGGHDANGMRPVGTRALADIFNVQLWAVQLVPLPDKSNSRRAALDLVAVPRKRLRVPRRLAVLNVPPPDDADRRAQVGSVVQSIIDRSGLSSQKALAARTGVSASSISSWRRGASQPQLLSLIELAEKAGLQLNTELRPKTKE